MDPQSPPKKSVFKSRYFYSAVVFVAVLSYVAILFATRYKSNRAYQHRIAEKETEQQRANDRAAIEELGGNEFAIRALYISPTVIHRGQSAQLCYDVSNAKSVTLNPPAGPVWPSYTRCLDLSPKKTTTYTLTITDASGKSLSQSVQLEVR